MHMLDTFQNSCLRRILGVRWPELIQEVRSSCSQQGSKEEKMAMDWSCFEDAAQ